MRFNMRVILRWTHIIVAIPIYGYLYSRYVFFPIMVLTGLLMWKGHLLRKVLMRSPARHQTAS